MDLLEGSHSRRAARVLMKLFLRQSPPLFGELRAQVIPNGGTIGAAPDRLLASLTFGKSFSMVISVTIPSHTSPAVKLSRKSGVWN